MPERESELESFVALIGQKARGCWLGYASALFLEFGEPQPLGDRQKHPHGEWGLWSDRILWRIEQEDCILAGSGDSDSIMESALRQIDGRTLVSAQISESTFVTTSREDSWVISTADGNRLTLGAGARVTYESGLR